VPLSLFFFSGFLIYKRFALGVPVSSISDLVAGTRNLKTLAERNKKSESLN
jgi:hypothetical protein